VLGADRSVAAHLPTAVKKVQDSTTSKLKYLLRAMHLLSSGADGGSSVTPGNENRYGCNTDVKRRSQFKY
jgi:hypothetical protein